MAYDSYSFDPSNGAYTFRDPDGNTFTTTGVEAQKYAQQLDYRAQQQAAPLALDAPTGMPRPEKGQDRRLAAAPGPVVDLGEVLMTDPPPPPPKRSDAGGGGAADASRQLDQVGAQTDAALRAGPAVTVLPETVIGGSVSPEAAAGVREVDQAAAAQAPPAAASEKKDPSQLADERKPSAPTEQPYNLLPIGQTSMASQRSTTATRELGPSPEAEQAVDKATDRSIEAQRKSARADAEMHEKSMPLMTERERASQQYEADVGRIGPETNKHTAKIVDKVEQAVDAVAAGKEDPDRWWHSRTTGQKISAALGAFFSGAGGSQNPTAFIERAIQRDIDAQRQDMHNKKDAVTLYQQVAQMVRQQGGDEIAQAAAMRDAAYGVVIAKLDYLTAERKAKREWLPVYDKAGKLTGYKPEYLAEEVVASALKEKQAQDRAIWSARKRGTVSSTSATSTQVTRDDMQKVPAGPGPVAPSFTLRDLSGKPHRYQPRGIKDEYIKDFHEKASKLNELNIGLRELERLYDKKALPEYSDQYESASQRVAKAVERAADMGVLQKFDAEQATKLQSGIFSGRDVIRDLMRWTDDKGRDLILQANPVEVPMDDDASAQPQAPVVLGRSGHEKGKHRK